MLPPGLFWLLESRAGPHFPLRQSQSQSSCDAPRGKRDPSSTSNLPVAPRSHFSHLESSMSTSTILRFDYLTCLGHAGRQRKLLPRLPGLNKTSRLNAAAKASASSPLSTYKKPAAVGGGSPSPSSKRALAIAEEGDENANQHAGAPPAKRACISAATSTAPSTAPSSPSPRRAAAPAVTTTSSTTKTVVADSPSAAATTTPRKQQQETEVATATPEQERQGSHSPEEETSAIFDNSQLDNSQLTTVTEPDHPSPSPQQQQNSQEDNTSPVAAAAAARASSPQHTSPSSQSQSQPQPPLMTRPRALSSMTREQARQKAEILRLRLGLARYKVRTGQTDVPLERLQRRPVPGSSAPATAHDDEAVPVPVPTAAVAAPGSAEAPVERRQQRQRAADHDDAEKGAALGPVRFANSHYYPATEAKAPQRLYTVRLTGIIIDADTAAVATSL
ncbi:hypothetical protein PG997_015399 [Apiospora hydei]|uniref:Uncharacterized protein n=1 Tax=Apiospora hydei TaxID=1337664 RepID=A0ABR1UQJ3_9PEZI